MIVGCVFVKIYTSGNPIPKLNCYHHFECNVQTKILWLIQMFDDSIMIKNYIVTSEFILMLFLWFTIGMLDFRRFFQRNFLNLFLRQWLALLPFSLLYSIVIKIIRAWVDHFLEAEMVTSLIIAFFISTINMEIYWPKNNHIPLDIDILSCVYKYQ